MAPNCKLAYFNVKGWGEPVRYIMSYGCVEYKDLRTEREKWPVLKSNKPFGNLPILEPDGELCDQSVATCRYLAKQFNLAGKDDWENLEIDSIVDTFGDMRQLVANFVYENDKTKKEELRKIVFGEQIPYYMNKFEEIVKNNDGHFVGGKLTWADIYFVSLAEQIQDFSVENIITPGRPHVKALLDKVRSLPGIKSWLEKRPQ